MVLEKALPFDYKHVTEIPDPREKLKAFYLNLKDILGGIIHMHKKGILHRDLKLSNLVIDIEDKKTVKIIDLGVAKALEEYCNTYCRGTIIYMAPEVKNKKRLIYGQKADVYSFGALSSCLWHGDKRFNPARVSFTGLPKKLETMLIRCVHEDPKKRPYCREVLALIDSLLSNL